MKYARPFSSSLDLSNVTFPASEIRTPRPLDQLLRSVQFTATPAVFALIVARQAFAAPIRAYLPDAWYLPDVAAGIAVLLWFVAGARQNAARTILISLAALAWILFSATGNDPLSIAFSARIFLLFVVGLMAGVIWEETGRAYRPFFAAIALLVAASVFYDNSFTMPWTGKTFQGALGLRDISREWWLTNGERRIAGFGIASTDTALVLAAATFAAMGAGPSKSRLKYALLAIPVISSLWLTHQRASTFWFTALWALSVGTPLLLGPLGQQLGARALKLATLWAIATCATAPFLLSGLDIAGLVGQSAPSLLARTMIVWPTVIEWLSSPKAFLVGAGLGSAGEAASTFALRSPDNLFLNFAVMVGVPGAMALAALGARGIIRARLRADTDLSALAIAALLVLNGITANIVTGATGAVFLGLALGHLLRPSSRRTPLSPHAQTPLSRAISPDVAHG